MPRFRKLTEFFAWLSINPKEGNRYITLGHLANYPGKPEDGEKNKAKLRKFLKKYLSDRSAGYKAIMKTADSPKPHTDFIVRAINKEQKGRFKSTFKYGSQLWTIITTALGIQEES
jgi:hypothetical protein